MTINKIGNKRIEEFPPTTIYLDDLVEIINILSETCKEVLIRAGDYEITDITDLNELATKFQSGRFDNVHLRGSTPYITVDLRSYGISAYISSDTADQRGAIARIADVINRGKKNTYMWVVEILTAISVGCGIWQLTSKCYIVGILLFILPFVSIPFFVRYEMKNKVVIHTSKRANVKSFIYRKKDEIVLAIISAIIGGIISYALRKLF